MKPVSKALIVWLILMVLFLLLTVCAHRYGDRFIKRIDLHTKMSRGLEMESLGKLDDAISLYENAVSTNEENLGAQRLLVRAYIGMGRFSEALSQAELAVEVVPRRSKLEALLLLSDVRRQVGLADKARHSLEQALQMSSRCAEAHYGMAKVAESMRAYPLMVEEFHKAAELGIKGSSSEFATSRSLRRLEIAKYREQIQEKGDLPGLYYGLGIETKETGCWEDALEAFGKAVGLDAGVADAHFWLGVQAEIDGDLNGAIARYRKVLDRCPDHANALLNLERCLLLRKVAGQPTDARAWYRLGLLSFRFRNWEQACRDFGKAVEIDPTLADAHFRLGRSLEMLGKASDAQAEYAQVLRVLPSHLRALKALQDLRTRE